MAVVAFLGVWLLSGWWPLGVAAAVVVHAADLFWRPVGQCWLCKGTGTRPGSTSEKSGWCLVCGGKRPWRRGARTLRRALGRPPR